MARDPYQYFRVEARELLEGLAQGILQLEKGTCGPDVVARLLRLAHTLKGAARVVKQPGIAELSHTVEGILTTHREAGKPLSKEQGNELLGLTDAMVSRLSALEAGSDVLAAGPVCPKPEEPRETLRVEIEEMDSLLRTVAEASAQLSATRKGLDAATHLREQARMLRDLLPRRTEENGLDACPGTVRARAIAEELGSGLDHFERSLAVDLDRASGRLDEIRDIADRLWLVPAQTVFPSLERSVRDAAQALGKSVDFEASGGEVRLDANVLASLRDALMHVVRNAVAHGVESEAERVAIGKSPTGLVQLKVERRGGRVAFVCKDDGGGIDAEAVGLAAVARGLVPASEAKSLPADRIIALLCAGGLTTSNTVTEVSGRGIGLDVVRTTTSRLKGEMTIRSEPGRGAVVEVLVPISVASLQALVVEAAGALAAIPLDAVRQTIRVRDAEVARAAEGDSILHEGTGIPFLPLDRILQCAGAAGRKRGVCSAVIVQAGGRSVAVGVDRLLGISTVVIRSLPGVVEADPVVLGASLDAEGNPQLVLDPTGLVEAAERFRGPSCSEAPARRSPVLVIDDSLTTRMLEQSILESGGYEVELAASAEEALTKAHARRCSLFIVDVEMPGMDGFDFVAHARSDPALRDIPAILVTSRNAPEDRRRAEMVGARAYIVKGEFDQEHLLRVIRTLVG